MERLELALSGAGVIFGVNAGTLFVRCTPKTPLGLDLASDPRSFGNPNLDKLGFIFNFIAVVRPCSTSSGGRSRNSERSKTLSKGIGLVQRSRFHATKRACISARIVSILAE